MKRGLFSRCVRRCRSRQPTMVEEWSAPWDGGAVGSRSFFCLYSTPLRLFCVNVVLLILSIFLALIARKAQRLEIVEA